MKKLIVSILAAALAVVSCTKGTDPDAAGVVGGHTDNYNQLGRAYMMDYVDQLFASMLEELEQALDVNSRELVQSAHFAINGSLTKPSVQWAVKAKDSGLCGMTLRCDEADTRWTLSFEGDYLLGQEFYSNIYPTKITLSATRKTQEQASGWLCVLEGERTERKGYKCTFWANAQTQQEGLLFLNTRGAQASGWDKVYGNLYMNVYKDKEAVDACCLSFEGSPALATFVRGL